MKKIEIHKCQLFKSCKNEIEEEIVLDFLLENSLSFKPTETKFGVTKNKIYTFFKSKLDNEYVFIDDDNDESVVWIAVDGNFIFNNELLDNKILNNINYSKSF